MKLFIAVFACLALASAEYTVKTKDDLIAYRDECVKALDIPAESVEKFKKLEFEDTPLVHKYASCMFEKFGFYTKEDGFNVNFLHKQVDPEVNHDNHGEHNELHHKIQKCVDEGKTCAYTVGQCLLKEDIQIIKKTDE
ncbi:Obp99a.2 family protein [Megaselia abdita]